MEDGEAADGEASGGGAGARDSEDGSKDGSEGAAGPGSGEAPEAADASAGSVVTRTAERSARTADGRPGKDAPARDGAQRDSGEGGREDVARGGSKRVAKGVEQSAADVGDAGEDGAAAESGDVDSGDASDEGGAAEGGGARDAGPGAAPNGGPRSVLRPLVSDIPEPRISYGTPGTPTRATPAPHKPAVPGDSGGAGSAPSRPGKAPRKSAAAPAPLPPAVPVPAKSAPGSAPGSALGSGSASGAAPGQAAPGGEAPAGGEIVGPEGTRAMPVPAQPDKEPLKLLAELTNTPPPPETLLRTTARRVKIWTPLLALLVLVFVLVQALRPLPAPTLAATTASSYTFAGAPLPGSMPWPAEGQTAVEVEGLGSLGVRGAQTPVPIASVTKVMTAYVILRDHPLSGKEQGPLITVDKQAGQEAGSEDESTAPVHQGQKFSERQMLQLLLIPSGNNIARLLARWDSGTQAAFVVKMQRTAQTLGMTHTTYTGASGLESTTRSTASDLLKLDRVVMRNDVFKSVVAQPNVTLPGVGRIFNNNNDLVHPGVIGVKTGSSTPAGGALMWAATKKVDGKEQLILGVTLQQHAGTTVDDSLQAALDRSLALMQSVQGGLAGATIVKKGQVVGEIDDGLGTTTPVVAARDLTAIGWPGMKTSLSLSPAASGIPHSAKAGTTVGTLSFGTGAARTSVPVTLRTDLSEPSFTTKLTRLS